MVIQKHMNSRRKGLEGHAKYCLLAQSCAKYMILPSSTSSKWERQHILLWRMHTNMHWGKKKKKSYTIISTDSKYPSPSFSLQKAGSLCHASISAAVEGRAFFPHKLQLKVARWSSDFFSKSKINLSAIILWEKNNKRLLKWADIWFVNITKQVHGGGKANNSKSLQHCMGGRPVVSVFTSSMCWDFIRAVEMTPSPSLILMFWSS